MLNRLKVVLLATIVFFMGGIVLVGTPASAATENDTLRVAVTVFPNSLDLPMTSEGQAMNVCWQLYNSLVWIDDTGTVVPALAESWTVSDDGQAYTFKLRQEYQVPQWRSVYSGFRGFFLAAGVPGKNAVE